MVPPEVAWKIWTCPEFFVLMVLVCFLPLPFPRTAPLGVPEVWAEVISPSRLSLKYLRQFQMSLFLLEVGFLTMTGPVGPIDAFAAFLVVFRRSS